MNVFSKIKEDIFPEPQPIKIILKIATVHLLTTLLVLTFCPQFGLGLGFGSFKSGHYGLTGLFMAVSAEFCQLACGAFLLFTSGFVILLGLFTESNPWSFKVTEREWFFSQKYLMASLILVLTGSFFVMKAPDVTLLNLVLWIIGAGLAFTGLDKFHQFFSTIRH